MDGHSCPFIIMHIIIGAVIFEHQIAMIFLSISLNMCFVFSKESSQRDGSFGYPQHMF